VVDSPSKTLPTGRAAPIRAKRCSSVAFNGRARELAELSWRDERGKLGVARLLRAPGSRERQCGERARWGLSHGRARWRLRRGRRPSPGSLGCVRSASPRLARQARDANARAAGPPTRRRARARSGFRRTPRPRRASRARAAPASNAPARSGSARGAGARRSASPLCARAPRAGDRIGERRTVPARLRVAQQQQTLRLGHR
jgi:hypothetical protein